MNLVKNTNSRIVYTINPKESPSTSQGTKSKPAVTGTLRINKTVNTSERVKIVVSLRKLSKVRPVKDWLHIINRRQPTTVARKDFAIDKNFWLSEKGINWVIPTPLFNETTITIQLDSSPLLQTGFILEIFRRDSTTVHEVPPCIDLTIGCTIDFKISWNLSTNAVGSTPTVIPSRWSISPQLSQQSSRPSSQQSSNLSLNSGSFRLNRLGISSEEDN